MLFVIETKYLSTRWTLPVAQQLTESIVPLIREGCGQPLDCIGGWSLVTPHGRASSLLLGIVGYEATVQFVS